MSLQKEKSDIERTTDFIQLYNVLVKSGMIIGSGGSFHHAGKLMDIIDELREKLENMQRRGQIPVLTKEALKEMMEKTPVLKTPLYQITRGEGLRVKVRELAIKEVIDRV